MTEGEGSVEGGYSSGGVAERRTKTLSNDVE